MDDDVLIEPHLVTGTCLHGNSHSGVSTDVPDLAVFGQVRRDKFIAVQPDPDDRHLRTTVRLKGHEVCQRGTFEHCARGVRNPGHAANVPPPRANSSRSRAQAPVSDRRPGPSKVTITSPWSRPRRRGGTMDAIAR